jgi:NAD(P)-dependent dehydrogenase (short-subunit alcohol dehydrogenase family)
MTEVVTTSLAGKVALVTGAAGAFGRDHVHALAAAGATVAAVDHDLGAASGATLAIDADVSHLDGARHVADRVVAELGGVDILVTNGTSARRTPLDATREQALADFDGIVATNTAGPFLVQRAIVASMIERGGGDIITITTTDVLPPRDGTAGTNSPDHDVVNASRWAILGFTQAWALGLRRRGIRVNALAVDPDVPADHAAALLALLAEGPSGRTGETIGVHAGAPIHLPTRRQRGDEIL